MPIVETRIDRFDGGITNDPRDPRSNVFRILSNFDAITSPKKLTPYRSSESGDGSASTSTKRNFCVALRTPASNTYALFSLGVVSGTGRAEVLFKSLTTGAATDLDDNSWDTPSNNQSSAGSTSFNLFVYYQKTGYIYGARAGTQIWRFDPDSGDAWADSHQAVNYTHIGQGVVHSGDDILYVPYYYDGGGTPSSIVSAIAKNNNGTWGNTAFTLPKHYIPTTICEFGNFLAIGCVPTSGLGNSKVFLWDRDATNALASEAIDWGEGMLMILEEVDGELVGISQKGGTATSFTGIPNGSSTHRDRVIFRKLIGNRGKKFFELQANHSGSANTTQLPLYKQKVDNRLYFQMLIELNGAVRDGVWSIGRSAVDQPLALVHERTSNNSTALTTSDSLRGFIMVGDYLFQSYVASSVHATTKTDDEATYSHNSVVETKRFDGSIHGYDASYYKELLEATVDTEYMPTAGQIILAYRKDQDTSWTTIFTNTTDNSISRTGINIAASGAALPKDYKEIEFRGVSSGGAEITGLYFREDIKVRKHDTA